MTCPTFEELLGWIQARAGDDGTGAGGPDGPDGPPAEHVAGGCPACARRLRLLDGLARTLGRDAPTPVPDALRRDTLSRLAAADAASRPAAARAGSRDAGLAGPLRRAREYLAELLLAGPPPALAGGLRGESDAVHRVYAAGPYQVDVALVERSSVVGQVSGEAAAMQALRGATCILVGPGAARETALVDDGAFRFERLGPAAYALLIDGAGTRLVVPDVDLRSGPDDVP